VPRARVVRNADDPSRSRLALRPIESASTGDPVSSVAETGPGRSPGELFHDSEFAFRRGPLL